MDAPSIGGFLGSTLLLDISNEPLNGQGNRSRGQGKITKVKQYENDGQSYPYFFAQVMRRWVRGDIKFINEQYNYFDRTSKQRYYGGSRKSVLKSEDWQNPGCLCIDQVYYIVNYLFKYNYQLFKIPNQQDQSPNNVSANRLTPYHSTGLNPVKETVSVTFSKERGLQIYGRVSDD